MESLQPYWDRTIAVLLPYWEAAVAFVAGIPAPELLGLYAPGLVLIGLVLGYAIRANISRRRRNRARRERDGWARGRR